MPVISVTLIRGYDDATLRRLCERLTDAAMSAVAAPADAVTICVHQIEPAGYMRGRMARTPGPAAVPPAELCLNFLSAQGAREIDRAMALCAREFRMTFPGGAEFTEISDLAAWGAARYRRIAKDIERVEESLMGERAAVYVSGTLNGERPDGTRFSGIRFVDRFEVADGRIVRQEVWNDMGESL